MAYREWEPSSGNFEEDDELDSDKGQTLEDSAAESMSSSISRPTASSWLADMVVHTNEAAEPTEFVNFNDVNPLDLPVWGFDLAPKKFALKESSIQIEDDFSRILKHTSSFDVPTWLAELSKSIKTMDVKPGDGTVAVSAQGVNKIDIGPPVGEISMNNPSFKLKFDAKDPNKIEIVDVKGAETKLGKVQSMSLCLATDADGKPVIKAKVVHTAAEEKPPAKPPSNPYDFLKNEIKSGLDKASTATVRLFANMSEVNIPVQIPAEHAKEIFENAQKFSKIKTFADVANLLGDTSNVPFVKDAVKDIVSVTRSGANGEKLSITRKGESTIAIGALELKLSDKIEMNVDQQRKGAGTDGTTVGVSNISGISAKLPVPKEILDKIGMPADVTVQELSFSEKQADGTRRLTLKTKDHGDVSLNIGANGLPVTDKGNLTVEVNAKVQGQDLPCTITFNPEKAAKAGPEGPDFTIAFKDSKGLPEVLKQVVGGSLGPAEQLAQGLKEIRKEGNKITLAREANTSAEMGGLVVEADKNVSFKVEKKGGVLLSDVSGISYKFKMDLGAINNALDLPQETKSTNVTSFSMSNPDDKGQQKVVVRGTGPVAAVAIHLKEGKIATDPGDNNRGSIYTMIRQARTASDNGKPDSYIPVIIKVNENGQPAMTRGEIASTCAEAVYATINKDKFRGFEPIMTNGKEMFTGATGSADNAPEAYIPGYDLKVRMALPNYRGGQGVVLYHDGARLKAVAPNGDEWELRQLSGYKQSKDKYDLDKTCWVKTEGEDLRWPASGNGDKAPVITIPTFGIDVRMHLPEFDGSAVHIQVNGDGVCQAVGGGKVWELKQHRGYNQQRDGKNPNMTYWERIK